MEGPTRDELLAKEAARKEAGRKRAKRYREKERAKVKEPVGQDATRVSRLGHQQLTHLCSRIVTVEEDDHGYGPGFEAYTCHYADLPLIESSTKQQKARYQPMVIYKSEVDKDADDYYPMRGNQGFIPTQLILAWEGKFASDKMDEASHLCDNPLCVRPEHLIWEAPLDNAARKNCPGTVRCKCCNTMHNVCQHQPECLKLTGF